MSNPYFSAELGETYHIKLDSAFTTVSEQIAAAGPGTAWVLPPRTTANILAYATPVVGMLCQASDTGIYWEYYNSAWHQKPYSGPIVRHDSASYAALTPNAAYADIHVGTASETHLVTLFVAAIGTIGTEYEVRLSDDGGTGDDLAFVLDPANGLHVLGRFVVDAATHLAGKSITANNIAFTAEMDANPANVRRLSGLSSGQVFGAAPIYSGALATVHTASGTERVVIYAGRVPGSTGTKWLGIYGPTTTGADTPMAKANRDANSVPFLAWFGTLNNGEVVKIGAEEASKFVWGGYAEKVVL